MNNMKNVHIYAQIICNCEQNVWIVWYKKY